MEQFDALVENHNIEVSKAKLKDYNSLVFAFLGDAIHTLFVRSYFVLKSNEKAGALHLKTSKFVKASAQAKMLDKLVEHLTEEELQTIKTARNSYQKNIAKNANLEDYKKATGFEALIGYLYLTHQIDRMKELLNKSLEIMENL